MPTITLTWNAHDDARTCPICKALNGFQWVFNTRTDATPTMPSELTHPSFGVVWNIQLGSRAHGHDRYNCRCHITPQIDVSDLKIKIQRIQEGLKAAAESKGGDVEE